MITKRRKRLMTAQKDKLRTAAWVDRVDLNNVKNGTERIWCDEMGAS